MWLKFKNDVMVNLDHVLSITKSEYGHKLIFLGMAGYATTLGFTKESDVQFVLEKITTALAENVVGIQEIDATPTT
jgi:hypothetical protein